MTTSIPKNILVIRNDKLGDFMLAWPCFQAVKQLFPEATIYTLVPEYTRPMAELCPWIDKIILDNDRDGISGIRKTTARIKNLNIDAALCLHSTPRIALALFFAGIPHRFAPASRIDQLLYNHTLKQRRSRSEKPEFKYNTDLSAFVGNYYITNNSYNVQPPFLSFPEEQVKETKKNFYTEYNIDNYKKLVFIHAGTGGSASSLAIDQYAKLIKQLSKNTSLFFILTSGPGEEELTKSLSKKIIACEHVTYHSNKGLVEFAKLLSIASLFISGSTGTLHIAGALDIPTVAFYPKRKSATSLRWQTLNSEKNRLAFNLPKESTEPKELGAENICLEINNKYLKNLHLFVNNQT